MISHNTRKLFTLVSHRSSSLVVLPVYYIVRPCGVLEGRVGEALVWHGTVDVLLGSGWGSSGTVELLLAADWGLVRDGRVSRVLVLFGDGTGRGGTCGWWSLFTRTRRASTRCIPIVISCLRIYACRSGMAFELPWWIPNLPIGKQTKKWVCITKLHNKDFFPLHVSYLPSRS